MNRTKQRGFTLVELLVAIAVIGILISMLIPAVGKVMENARRAKGSNNMKQIALAYNQYMNDDVDGRCINQGAIADSDWKDFAENSLQWLIILGRRGFLNDPSVYCFSGDSLATSVVAKSIVKTGDTTATTSNAWGDETNPKFSVSVVAGIPASAPMSTTPIAFTRGLLYEDSGSQSVGTWSKTDGVYQDKGGYIAFLDGHVEWFENLGSSTSGKLVKWGGDGTTNNILEALPTSAYIFDADSSKEKVQGTGTGDSESGSQTQTPTV